MPPHSTFESPLDHLPLPSPPAKPRSFSVPEIRSHSTPDSCWLVIRNSVYDVTSWISYHPGGSLIYVNAGRDCTQLFDSYHPLCVRLSRRPFTFSQQHRQDGDTLLLVHVAFLHHDVLQQGKTGGVDLLGSYACMSPALWGERAGKEIEWVGGPEHCLFGEREQAKQLSGLVGMSSAYVGRLQRIAVGNRVMLARFYIGEVERTPGIEYKDFTSLEYDCAGKEDFYVSLKQRVENYFNKLKCMLFATASTYNQATLVLDYRASTPKLRVLCLHGFRTSAAIFEKQIVRWDPSILEALDLMDLGKSEAEGIFPEPYFEWYQANKDYSEFTNLEECKQFITNYMQEHGPFDGLMGLSQGGVLAAAFAGLQQKGLVLHHHPLVAGAGFNNQQLMHEWAQDFFKKVNEELVLKFENPLVIRHEGGHIVPTLGEEPTKLLRDFFASAVHTSSRKSGDRGDLYLQIREKEEDPNEIEREGHDGNSLFRKCLFKIFHHPYDIITALYCFPFMRRSCLDVHEP